MIRIISALVTLTSALIACSGSDADSSLLRLSDEAMRRLGYVRVAVDVRATVSAAAPYHEDLEFRGPLCLRRVDAVSPPLPTGAWTGLTAPYAQYFDRAPGGAFGPGPHAGATAPTNVRFLRREVYDGHAAYVIAYEFKVASFEGPFTISRTEWIDAATLLLLRQEQDDNDPFGDRAHVTAILSNFDAMPSAPCV